MDKKCPKNPGRIIRKRRPLTVAQKLDIIARVDRGERSKDIKATFNLSSSTIRTVYLQKEKLSQIAVACAGNLRRIKKAGVSIMPKLENLLRLWIDEQSGAGNNLSFPDIKAKALSVFEELRNDDPSSKNIVFKASPGWFDRFKSRSNIKMFRMTGEKGLHIKRETEESEDDRNEFSIEVDPLMEDNANNRSPSPCRDEGPEAAAGHEPEARVAEENDMCDDLFEIFGKSVGMQLKMLPRRQAIETQLKIQNLLSSQLLMQEEAIEFKPLPSLI